MALEDLTDEELIALAQQKQATQSLEADNYGAGLATELAQGSTLGFGDELGAGVNALADMAMGRFPDESLTDAYGRWKTQIQGDRDQFRAQNPIASTAANIAGGIPTGIVAGAPVAASRLGVMGTEAALGGLEAYGSDENILQGAALGGALGGIGSLIGRPQRVAQGIEEIAQRAEARAGRRLVTRAQQTGSDIGKRLEAGMEQVPFAGGPTRRIKDNFQTELNQSAARSIGLDTDVLTLDQLDEARRNIGDMFDTASAGRNVAVPTESLDNMQNIVDSVKALPSKPKKAQKIGSRIIEELKDGNITDSRYQELSSDLRNSIQKAATTGDTPNMKALGSLNEELDNLFEQGLGGEALEEFKEARQLWRNYKLLTKRTGTVSAEGNVSGRHLFNEMAKGGRSSRVPGTELGDLAALSRIPGIGDSGTASRQIPMTAGIGGMGVGALGGMSALADYGLGLGATAGGFRLANELAQGAPGTPGAIAGSVQRAIEWPELIE